MRAKQIVVLFALLVLILPVAPAHAAGVVTTCDEANLLAALAGGGTVTFSCSGTITLSNPITISANTTIDGSGQSVTISGGNTMQVFNVPSGVTFTVNNLTIANGSTAGSGAGIFSQGALVVTNSTITGNGALAGGGLYNFGGTLTVSGSIISNNSGINGGGGINSIGGSLSVTGSTFSNNSTSTNGAGLRVANTTSASVTNSSFSNNNAIATAGYLGAGIFINGDATLYVDNVGFTGNRAVGTGSVGGGGIANLGRVVVSNSTFSSNVAQTYGGGILSGSGSQSTVTYSTFSNNSGETAGGGVAAVGGATVVVGYSSFTSNVALGGGVGGAIYNNGSTTTVNTSTFTGNDAGNGISAGGAIYNGGGTVNVSKSTFSANSAYSGGGIFSNANLSVGNSTLTGNLAASGGGIMVGSGTHSIINSTLSGNRGGGGAGSNIYYFGPLTLANTIVANGVQGANCGGTSTLTDNGGNLSWPDTTCPGINADPVLGALQNNGGPTFTMLPGGGSAAIDAGVDAICAAAPINNQEQRNGYRPVGAHCDSGAVEVGAVPQGILLADFGATALPDQVQVAWATTSELGNTGFNLWRAASPDGTPMRLNDTLIPSQGPGSSQGFSYTWSDTAGLLSGTTYYYWLEDVDVNGVATRHGPVSATYLVPTAVGFSAAGAASAPVGVPMAVLVSLGLVVSVVGWRARRQRSEQ